MTLHPFPNGAWIWSTEHRQAGQLIATETVWGQTRYRVWLPLPNRVLTLPSEACQDLARVDWASTPLLAYLTTAARIAEGLGKDILVAPIEAPIIPLPHQIHALSRAMSGDQIRYLLADEVGLGKTIEAGLIIRELKLRGLVHRVLVVAPKGLVPQWAAELRTHFGEAFRPILPGEFNPYRRFTGQENHWLAFDQVICPMDGVKPIDSRRGWSREQVAEYNRERFDDLIAAGWDLIIVDEAHRLAGATDAVARFRLGRGLADAAPYLLLLSATPHQGKSESFHRLLSLLDERAFPDPTSITRERVTPYVIRTEKRAAINAQGQPLFQPRQTRLEPVFWEPEHGEQHALYEAVTDYVRHGYNRAMREQKSYIGFLMILMQRLVTSSTAAIRATLERRLAALDGQAEQPSFLPLIAADDWAEADGQEQLDHLLSARLDGHRSEQQEVQHLLELTRRADAAGPDAKAEALLRWLYRLQQDESDPDLKFLIFTEFVPTQQMLRDFLAGCGFAVVCLNGSMDIAERQSVQAAFAGDARIMIATEAGGEGLNLQFCHIVINYDIPWNPMRLEQRIGRVDRIGQQHPVRAINLLLAETVEFRVREVLEEKLQIILKEFGADKTGDVLDSAEAGVAFDSLFVETLLNPQAIDQRVNTLLQEVRQQAAKTQAASGLLGGTVSLSPLEARRLSDHPMPSWTERMTVNYLLAHGGRAERTGGAWRLTWPDGTTQGPVIFTARDRALAPGASHLTLGEPRIRRILEELPAMVPGQAIPRVNLPLPESVRGYWSLWQVALRAADRQQQRFLPLFVQDDGRVFLPTARAIWEHLQAASPEPLPHVYGAEAETVHRRLRAVAEVQGKPLYDRLIAEHERRIAAEEHKVFHSFAARRRAIERIGLPQVRQHRLASLAGEERAWEGVMHERRQTAVSLAPVLILRAEGGDSR